MEEQNYTWEVTFDVASKTMMCAFGDRVRVICDFNFGIMITVRDGEPIDRFEYGDMTIDEYVQFLLSIARASAILKQRGHE
jgi:hypothetical protein